MKYTYVYKTSDGVRHEGVCRADCREDVFAQLRQNGIKAIKVVAADGSKANGEIRGVRKRMVVLAVGLAALGAIIGTALYFRVSRPHPDSQALQTLSLQMRRQLIGDAAVIEKGILTGWSNVFPSEGDRFLASFAIPGVKAGKRNTTVDEIRAVLGRTVPTVETDGIETRQIKAMVEGMKREARAYIAAGGSIVGYGQRLTERQDAEIALYERAKAEIEAAKKSLKGPELVALWEKRNDQLRNLGIRLISLED